jgi:sugar phosphate isomerase/epimerase
VSYAGGWGQACLTIEETIDRAAKLGFDGLMIMAKRPHASLLDMAPDVRKRLRDRIQERGLEMACIAGYTNFTADAEHGEVPHREFQILHVAQLAKLAVDLGGSVVRIMTGYEHPALPFTRAWDSCMEAIRECSKRSADVGVVIAVQNHHDVASHSIALEHLLDEIGEPNCRAAFDAWTPTLHGEDVAEAATRLVSRTVHTTAADYRSLPRYCYQGSLVNFERGQDYRLAVPMGDGDIDYRVFLGALQNGGYDGYVAYEMCSRLRDGGDIASLDAYADRFIDWMRTNGFATK